MSNAYRIPAENTGLNWPDLFGSFYAKRGGMNASAFASQLEKEDKWAPGAALDDLADSNLGELFAASARLQKMSQQNSFYAYYKKIIDKVILQVVERAPESFDMLNDGQKEMVFGTKIEMPDEEQFYGHVYAVLENPGAMAASGVYFTGQNFEDILKRLVEEEKVLSEKVADVLARIDGLYTAYFLEAALKRDERAQAKKAQLEAAGAPEDTSPQAIRKIMEEARRARGE